MYHEGGFCPHNITETDPETQEEYCIECGEVIETEEDNDEL